MSQCDSVALSFSVDVLNPLPKDPSLDDDDPTEGVYHFVQATWCQWQVVASVFDNPNPGVWIKPQSDAAMMLVDRCHGLAPTSAK
jgi:hypothetical protein